MFVIQVRKELRFDTLGVAPVIKDIQFGGLIAEQAFDSNLVIEA